MGDSAAATGVTAKSGACTELAEKLQDEQQVKRYAKFLHANIPLREALQLSKRVNYFRGRKLLEVLLGPAAAGVKNKPECNSEDEARLVGVALLRMGLIHASEVADKKKRELRPVRTLAFSDDGYYTWIYEGSKTMRNVMLGVLVFAIAAMCLFPIWPASAKVGIWYFSVTLLIFLFVLFTIRLIVFIVFWCIGFDVWILPNFFDEDLGVMDSFRPVFSFSKGDDLATSIYFRAAGFVLLVAFGYWCAQQPTEFDELYAQQMDFLSELYDGKLLSDQAAIDQEAIEKAIPKLEELEKQILEEDEEVEDLDEDLDEDEDASDAVLDSALERDEADEAAGEAADEATDEAADEAAEAAADGEAEEEGELDI